jgi:nucleoid-associated protein YgaU
LGNLTISATLFSLCLYSSVVWAEPQSTRQDVDPQSNAESELMVEPGQAVNEVSQQNDRQDVPTRSAERHESVLQMLKQALDHNTQRLSVVEERLLKSSAEKEIEINRLNAALAAMIVEAENAEKLRVDLESRLQRLLTEKEQAFVSQQKQKLVFAEKDAEIDRLKNELSESKRLVKNLEEQNQQRAVKLKSSSDKLQNMTQKLEASVSEFGALEQALNQTQVDLVNVTDREALAAQALAQFEEDKRHLQGQLDSIRARLPAVEGGSADIVSVREQAAELGRFYREAFTTATNQSDVAQSTEVNPQLEQSRTALIAEQMLLGRLLSARGIYTIKPDDSLSGISYAMYGSSNFWPKIFKTNSHILSSPNQLVPGYPLIIP